MERPRIRWVEASPIVRDGKEVILLRDAEEVVEHGLVVSREIAVMISLMDGTRTLDDIQSDFAGSMGEVVNIDTIREIVDALDSNLFLLNERYRDHYARLREDYGRLSVRPSSLAGRSYAADKTELLTFVDKMLKTEKDCTPAGEVKGIVAPHIDYARGGEAYRDTYRFLRDCDKPLFVIFGTCHRFTKGILSISCKDFETPLGIIPHAEELSGFIRSDHLLGGYVDEWPHRSEHSIELQLPLLQFVMRGSFEILPILTGSMHEYVTGEKNIDDGEINEIVERLKKVLKDYGKHHVILAGADLAHIGAQFGDKFVLDETRLAYSRRCDEAILEAVKKVDAKEFLEIIKEEGDSRRICGLTPIYFQLKLLEGSTCDIVSYGQWTDGKSSVSFGGGIFY